MDSTALQKEIELALKNLTEQHQQLSNSSMDNPPEVMMEFISGLKMLYSKALVLQHQRELRSIEILEKAITARHASTPTAVKAQPVYIESVLPKGTPHVEPEIKAPVQEVIQIIEQISIAKPAPVHPSMDDLLLAAANKAAQANQALDPTRKKKVITDIHDKFDEVPTMAGKYSDHETLATRMAGSKTQTGVAEKLQHKPISDLRISIGTNEKFLFINHLFGGDPQIYNSSIEVLNTSGNLESARKFITENLLDKYGWDTGTHPVTMFMDLIERRYIS